MILLKSFGLSRYSNAKLYHILVDEVLKRNSEVLNSGYVKDEILLQYCLSRMASLNERELYMKVKDHIISLTDS